MQHKELLSAGPPLLTLTLGSLMYNLGAYLTFGSFEVHNHPEHLQSQVRKTYFDIQKATENYGPCLIKQVAASKYNTNKQDNPSVECFN